MTSDRDDRNDDRVVPVAYASAGDVEAIRRRKTLRIQNIALASVLLGIILIAWQVSPPPVRSRPRSPCARNLGMIGRALNVYAQEHQNELPPDLETLAELDYIEPENLICPKAESDHQHYILIPHGTRSPDDHPLTPVVYEHLINHSSGGYICYMDGHAKWCPEKTYKETLADYLPDSGEEMPATRPADR
jgi:prepilin-type processing-associated H-X9-DG protein